MTDGFKFGNAAKIIEVAKVWDDQNNADGIRPNRVGINIIAKVNGVEKSEFSKVAEDGYFEITVDDVYSSYSNIVSFPRKIGEAFRICFLVCF